ncbi:glycosyltransferase family 4 protein [Flavobacterium sp.]|uniref:glycosyltransferase family 4 protein n=1 Tax=Flavobacterium sp. TaxID=239 RepID=UPI0026084A7F|nr:glycosyltransferase family 4 protein [Flavobacterium sp.]
MKNKLIRITTIPISLEKLLSGQLQFMNSYYQVIAVSSEKEKLEQLGKSQKIETYSIEMTRQITPIKDLIAVMQLYFFLKKTKPFIVHTHTPKAGIVGMLASKLAGVPVRLHTVAGLPLLEATGFKRKILDFVEKLTYKCATKVYPNSFGLLEIIKQNNYCSSSKLHVIANGSSNGIDTSYFNPNLFSDDEKTKLRKELSISTEDFVFIFVGRLVKDKGINELISAFNLLQCEVTNLKLLLVGNFESDLDPLSQKTLETIKNNKAIISVGFQTDVRTYFSISNALVFPSYREGFPNVVMQAGAMNLPSIVSNINGCNEIISNEVNGLIIAVKDEKAIFEAMKKITNLSVYDVMKSNARKVIVDNYEQEKVWNALLEEYQSFEKFLK